MPQLITYRSRPVKRRQNVPGGLLLIFYADRPGDRGEQLVVTDDEWRRHGCIRYYAAGQRPSVRGAAPPTTS